MKAYLIPKSKRFDEITIMDIDEPLPSLLVLTVSERGLQGKAIIPSAEFDLEMQTDIAVYKEREYRAAWMS